MRFFPILISSVALQTLAQSSSALTAQTQQGPVVGTLVTPTVRRFLGIPFGTASRWEAPQLPPIRTGNFLADKFGDSCIQQLSAFNVEYLVLSNTLGTNVSSSEDCLSVNIWAPSTNRKQDTAVMIWIYGGGFSWGTSNVPMYDGQNMVRDNDDLIVVTFNYRLNIFGQPNAPQLESNNVNFSLLDVEAAIKWVHDNIANFGGDPDRITLFGQSAGGAAADAYTFSHPQDTIVKGIIQQTGSITGLGNVIDISNPSDHSAWDTVAVALGCGSAPTPQQFSCMKDIAATTLEATLISTNTSFNLITEDVTFFTDTQTRAANGDFLHVPVLVGSNQHESDVFTVAGQLITAGFAKPVITEIISDIGTLTGGTCTTSAGAGFRVNANVPTWRYFYQAIFPGISTRQDLRAFHASEIPIVFGTYNLTSPTGSPSTTEIALSRYIQRAWVAFARNPTQGLIDFGWPLYNPNTTTLAQLGGITNQTGVAFTRGDLIDSPCADQTVLVQIENQLSTLLNA